MKIFILVALSLALAGCQQKTADQQLDEMYAYQLKHDPETAAVTAGAIKVRKGLTDEQKMMLVNAYAEMKKARAALEDAK